MYKYVCRLSKYIIIYESTYSSLYAGCEEEIAVLVLLCNYDRLFLQSPVEGRILPDC